MKFFLGILASLAAAVFALYRTAYYFTWQTAFSLPPEDLRRVQFDTYAWFAVFLAALAVAAVLVFRFYRATMRLREKIRDEF